MGILRRKENASDAEDAAPGQDDAPRLPAVGEMVRLHPDGVDRVWVARVTAVPDAGLSVEADTLVYHTPTDEGIPVGVPLYLTGLRGGATSARGVSKGYNGPGLLIREVVPSERPRRHFERLTAAGRLNCAGAHGEQWAVEVLDFSLAGLAVSGLGDITIGDPVALARADQPGIWVARAVVIGRGRGAGWPDVTRLAFLAGTTNSGIRALTESLRER